MLAYLVANERRTASRTRLADLLWSDRGEQQARNSLRQAVHELRIGEIGDAVDVGRAEIALQRGRFSSDLEQVAFLSETGDCRGLAALLAEVDGDYLQDLDGLSPAFDEWLRVERVRRRDALFAAALHCVGGPDARPTEAERALLRELERLDPLNEAVFRLLVRLDHAAGDVATMHRRHRRLAGDLSRELSVPPSHETEALFASLVHETPASREAPSPAPPPPPAAAAVRLPRERTPPVIAIIPFEADGTEPARMAAVLTEAVCAGLSHNREVHVVRSDVIGTERLPAMFEKAIAGFTVRGSVRQIGAATYVTAELSSVESGFLIWAEQFELDGPGGTRMPMLIGQIVGAIAPGVERHLAQSAPDLSPESEADQAASLYSRGKRMAREARTMAAVRDGIALLERAIALDPRHVGARLRLAQLYNTDFHYLMAGHDAAALRERAFALALESAEIEPASVRVRLRLAWCRLRQQDWEGASGIFHTVEGALAHDADALNECGFGLAQLGELDAARDLIQRAFRLNPFAPAEYHADFAVLQALQGNHSTAEAHFQVCGEQRLFWQVLRMSNLDRLDRVNPRLHALQDRFVRTFRTIWVGGQPPTLDDVLGWSRTVFCFQRREDRDLIAQGLTSAWLTCAPAFVGSSS